MPIRDFKGQTFVAFTDIAGFKAMMKDGRRGPEALDTLYSAGYRAISDQGDDPRVEGLFVSDSGVLFARELGSPRRQLEELLLLVEKVNRSCFERALSLTTSIAWGAFSYHQRFEITGIEKNPVYGNAYVAAFIDSKCESPRLFPNDCRIAKHDLPTEVVDLFDRREGQVGSRSRAAQRHYYFEWMRQVG
jgi:hypothetical protein